MCVTGIVQSYMKDAWVNEYTPGMGVGRGVSELDLECPSTRDTSTKTNKHKYARKTR